MALKNFKKSTAVFISLGLVFVLALTLLIKPTGADAVFFNLKSRQIPIYCVDRNDNKIAISFDCAYGNEYTQGILNVLKEYDVTCTFFTVKFWVDKFPGDVKNIIDSGNEIGTHSSTHPKMSTLSEDLVVKELEESVSAIKALTGKDVELFRAPFGDYNDTVINVAKSMGLYTVQWDVDSLDWKDISTSEIVKRVVNKTKSGSIILCHNNGTNTLKALPYILGQLKQKGYTFVKISDLIYKDGYSVNSQGKQIKS